MTSRYTMAGYENAQISKIIIIVVWLCSFIYHKLKVFKDW